jgi:hypothetical protein
VSDRCCDIDCALSHKILKLKSRSQDFFGIPENIQSPSNWASIASILRDMFATELPFDRLEVLKSAVREIPNLYERERHSRAVEKSGNNPPIRGSSVNSAPRLSFSRGDRPSMSIYAHALRRSFHRLSEFDRAAVFPVQENASSVVTPPHSECPEHISADDMFPIFIYLIVSSNLPFGLFALSHELNVLCDPQVKMSEAGYILATLEASVQHLMSLPREVLDDDNDVAAPNQDGAVDSEVNPRWSQILSSDHESDSSLSDHFAYDSDIIEL